MTGEYLSGKIGMDSTEYKAALAELNREMRVLESGFQAGAAGMANWTKSATGLENRIQSLNSQIDFQQKKVANLKAEHDRMVAAHGEGSRAAQDIEIKLNKETGTLNKMQAEVRNDATALQGLATEEKSAGAAAQTAGEGIGAMGAITAGVTAIVAGAVVVIGAMVAVAGALVAGIGFLVKTTMDWGQSLDNAMKLLGVTSGEAAGLKLMADAVGLSVDDLVLALDRMGKNLLTVDGKLGSSGKALKNLGIDVNDANGELKRTPDLLEEIANKLLPMKDGTEKTAYEMELFGRAGTKIDEILRQAADGGMQKYINQAQAMGLALTPAQVDQIHNLGMNINILKDQFIGIAMVLGITFIPALQSAVTWIGKTVEALMPAIKQWGGFLSLLLGVPAAMPSAGITAPTLPGDITGMSQEEINYMWVQYWRKKGPRPTGGTYTGGEGVAPAAAPSAAAIPLGGPGGESVSTALTPLQQAIMDLRDKVVNEFIPWFMGLDWPGFIKGIGDIGTFLISSETGKGTIFGNVTGTAQGENLSSSQQFLWDAGTWIYNNITKPFEDAIAAMPGDWAKSWQVQVADWLQTNIVGPIMDGTVWKDIKEIGTWIQKNICGPLVSDFQQIGDGLGNAIRGLVNKLVDYYNGCIDLINKILGTKIPHISHMAGGETPFIPQVPGIGGKAEGGFLDGWNKTGEKGYELVGPNGYVYPHDISVKLMELFGNVRALAGGGSLGSGSGTSVIEALLGALAQAQQQLAMAMSGYGMPAVLGAGGNSQAFSIYGPMIFQGDQPPGGVGDVLLKDRRY